MKIMKTKAYSLVELVLVLAIMSILISAISLKAEVIENYKAKNQIKKLVLDLIMLEILLKKLTQGQV